MRRLTSLFALAVTVGCGSEHGAEGTVVKPGPGIQGIPGGSQGVNAGHAVPVSGGTLTIARDGHTALAADPDRDRVFIVDIDGDRKSEVRLEAGDEPGRLVEDGAGRVHVATRRGGALVSIDIATAAVVNRRWVCPSPRGVAWDSTSDIVHVACQSGELVSLPAAGGEALRVLKLERDLRDVVVQGDQLLVSRFKAAKVFVVDAAGQESAGVEPPKGLTALGTPSGFEPAVAWRMIAARADSPEAGIVLAHQRANPTPIAIGPTGYYGGNGPCTGAIVEGAVSPMNPTPTNPDYPGSAPPAFPNMIGPSDIAISADGKELAVLSIGNSWGMASSSAGSRSFSPSPVPTLPSPKLINVNLGQAVAIDPCGAEGDDGITGEPTSVAFAGTRVVVQSREPAQLQVLERQQSVTNRIVRTVQKTISLTNDSRADTGVALFHMNSGFGVSCASCHPEGNEDGRIWQFAQIGQRRTQTVAGGVMGTAPFHWSGDMRDFTTLLHEVFESRMGGGRPNKPQTSAFQSFIAGISAPPPAVVESESAARGKALFDSPALGCASCHSGNILTNNESHDVGTRGVFQVPSLIGVATRAPFLHDGCATTLRDRFGSCGGGDQHGTTSQLTAPELDDLLNYLESL